MSETEVSRMVFNVLSDISPIETALVSMWSLSNKYARIPFLRFRFKGLAKDDAIYERLKNIVDNYSGRIRWRLITKDNVQNYVLLPEKFERFFWKNTPIDRDEILKVLIEKEYEGLIDIAIADVPDLAKYIKDSF